MNPLFDKPFTFDRVIRIVFGILVISGIIYLIALLRNALLPFLIAWLLAYMMQPFVKFFQYKLCFIDYGGIGDFRAIDNVAGSHGHSFHCG